MKQQGISGGARSLEGKLVQAENRRHDSVDDQACHEAKHNGEGGTDCSCKSFESCAALLLIGNGGLPQETRKFPRSFTEADNLDCIDRQARRFLQCARQARTSQDIMLSARKSHLQRFVPDGDRGQWQCL